MKRAFFLAVCSLYKAFACLVVLFQSSAGAAGNGDSFSLMKGSISGGGGVGESDGGDVHKSKYFFSNLYSILTYDGLLTWICSRAGRFIRTVCSPLFGYFQSSSLTTSSTMSIATLM